MSKMDALRAMREAKYAANSARARSASAAPAPTPRPTPVARPAKPAAATPKPVTAGVVEALCGHRNMSGRTCTREQGHSAKSHRYS